jgi:hypothetical protein
VVVRHKNDLALFCQAAAPRMEMTKVLYADEIGIGLLEAAPWWAKALADSHLPAAWTALPPSAKAGNTSPSGAGP